MAVSSASNAEDHKVACHLRRFESLVVTDMMLLMNILQLLVCVFSAVMAVTAASPGSGQSMHCYDSTSIGCINPRGPVPPKNFYHSYYPADYVPKKYSAPYGPSGKTGSHGRQVPRFAASKKAVPFVGSYAVLGGHIFQSGSGAIVGSHAGGGAPREGPVLNSGSSDGGHIFQSGSGTLYGSSAGSGGGGVSP
ncbi:hypothetical protein SeMB42_g03471 [Synchytrium endobioticum]|uniref:Uncharacterized protein n=1 Tax=Synchytrium endobioticum TaxID=286115 RepID=A0A507D6T5_9FUNG|nr:hypothetical protein SeMB42_g03471 [Synchytrium endobioticum]TPX50284.1 hypothetical protein SeLEV6574_g00980 [Synchytrium endobioticum]